MTTPKEIGIINTAEVPIRIEFFPETAPNHVKSFEKLVQEGLYDGTIFHRIVKILLYRVVAITQNQMAEEDNYGELEIQASHSRQNLMVFHINEEFFR
jgi:cyclophilin family peptidyl-prolyl cis-trans isomerase